jgi:hypothetical protein
VGDTYSGRDSFGQAFTGLGTVNCQAVSGEVPEPASRTMLMAGFGLTDAAMRRRRAAVVSA